MVNKCQCRATRLADKQTDTYIWKPASTRNTYGLCKVFVGRLRKKKSSARTTASNNCFFGPPNNHICVSSVYLQDYMSSNGLLSAGNLQPNEFTNVYERYMNNICVIEARSERNETHSLARVCVMYVKNDEHFLFENVSQFTLASTLLHCCLVLACISSNCACSLFWVMVFRYNTTAYNSWKNI